MSAVKLEKQGRIATLTLNRPEKMNPLGMLGDGEDFAAACTEINNDDEIRCAILTGAGRAFSAGGDIDAIIEKRGAFSGAPAETREGYREGVHRIITSLWYLQVPMVGAVNGAAIGLGNDLVTTADIRVASSDARFGATFTSLGLVPGDGGAWLLPKAIGSSRAAELFYTGDLIDAETALDWGLVSYVVEPDKLMEKSLEIAHKIAAKPPLPIRMTKQMMRQADNGTLEAIMEMACSMQAILHATEDHQVAARAVKDKTTGEYHGR